MTSKHDVVDALRRAAEALIGRSLTPDEVTQLIDLFNRADGSYREKAREALRRFTGLSEAQIREKTAASDNTDRVITDLHDILDKWKPK